MRPRPGEILEIADARAEDALDRLLGERHFGDHRLAVPLLEVLERRLLVAAHVRLEDHAFDRHRRLRLHERHVQRIRVARHHVRPERVSGRETPEDVAHRPDDMRLHSRRTAKRESSGMSEFVRNSRIAGSCSSTHVASVSASPLDLQTKQDARVILSETTYVRHPPDSAIAFAPRCTDAVSPPSVCASGTVTSSSARPVSTTCRPPTARTRRARPASCATETGICTHAGHRLRCLQPRRRGQPRAARASAWRARIESGSFLRGSRPTHRAFSRTG